MPQSPQFGKPNRRSDPQPAGATRRPAPPAGSSGLPAAALQSLVEDSDQGMILADATGIILYANAASERLLGQSPTDLRGKLGFDMVKPDDLPRARDAFGQCLEAPGNVVPLRVDVMHKDGTTRALAVQLVNRLSQPGVQAVVVHFRQVHRAEEAERELEAKLLQAQKMEAVGRMAAGIAHDFNNVLSVILGNSHMLADALPKEPGAHHQDLLELQRSANLGVAMVRKLLGYSRSAALNVAPTDVGALMESMRGMLRHLVPGPIAIEVNVARGSDAIVDPSAIEQMVLNLVTNARDAIRDRGTIRLDVRAMELREPMAPWLPAGAYVRLAVTDDGAGMDAATRARALEPFFTTKRAGAGNGLGLAMVYGLAKQQNGFVDIQSELGVGTTVSLYFPMGDRPQPAPA